MQLVKSVIILGQNLRSSAIYQNLSELEFDCCQIDKDHKIIAHTPNADMAGYEKLENYDLAILSGWSKRIKKEVLGKPKHGFLTCHAGMVPEYRGSSPLNWALINGENIFGLTVIKTNENFDEGAIYSQDRFDILPDDNIEDLHKITNAQFPRLVHEAILKIENNIPPTPQIGARIGYFPRRNKDDSKVDFRRLDAIEVRNLFRALVPLYPAPFFFSDGGETEIKSICHIDINFTGTPGKIYKIENNSYLIACRRGAISITIEGDRDMKLYQILD